MKDLRKELEKLAEENSLGKISDDLLVKASDNFKIKSEDFCDSYEYHIKVAKSFYDYLHKSEQNEEISKAIIPGQTKVIDGVVYIYTATPNAKTLFDWRVYNGKSKIGKQLSGFPTAKQQKQDYVNDLFPKDLSALKTIKSLGGSTGAVLVEDVNGNQYVKKTGSDDNSNAHVKNEYLANQIYDLFGVRVPDYELYDDGGNAVLLSKFIPLTKKADASNYDEMSKNFVVDALMANWDVYNNDNCLVDSAGRVIRVDNGSSLMYRAQGGKKQFTHRCDDFDSMKKYNASVVANLKPQDYIDQINSVLEKRADIGNYLTEIGEDNLASRFDRRIEHLESIKDDLMVQVGQSIQNSIPIVPRKLMPNSEMYRDFTDKELVDFWKNADGGTRREKFNFTDDERGWALLSTICKSRGFDARPLVVEEDEYLEKVKTANYQLFRGIDGNSNKEAVDFVNHFKFNDECFYGKIGVYGSGIYNHINDGNGDSKLLDQRRYKQTSAYQHAESYASSRGVVMDLALENNAKVIKLYDLLQEIKALDGGETPEVIALKDEMRDLIKEVKTKEDDLENLTGKITKDVKEDMHWDENTLINSQTEIESIDWGKLNQDGKPDYPDFNDFVKGKVFKWITDNGGKVTEKFADKKQDIFVLELPNSSQSFMITRWQYENNAIKRKNQFSKAYNYHIVKFQEFLMNKHYSVITNKINKELESIEEITKDVKAEISDIQKKVVKLNTDIVKLQTDGSGNKGIYSAIYSQNYGDDIDTWAKPSVGVYAALKGYDGIIVPKGGGGGMSTNGSSNSYMIVLNRSKVIVKR